jgi:two-component system cell cycle sensor histidine kinase PleC
MTAPAQALAAAHQQSRGETRGTSGQPELDADDAGLDGAVLHAFSRVQWRQVPIHVLLVGALVWVASALYPIDAGAPLTALLAGLLVIEALACWRVTRRGLRASEVARWRRIFLGVCVAQAGCWLLLLGLLVQPPGVAETDSFSLGAALVLSLIASASAMPKALLPGAARAGIVPLLPIPLMVIGASSDTQEAALAILTLAGQLLLLAASGRLERTAAAAARSDAAIAASRAALGQARNAADEAARQAERAELSKSVFLATVSHELRTPLNAILGFSEVMKNEVFGSHSSPSYREYSSDIHGSGQRLLALVNEILDLARLEEGQYALDEAEFTLGEVARSEIERFSAAAAVNGTSVVMRLDDDLPPVRADRRALGQMTRHLLSNAVKFSPARGRIEVRCGWTARGGQYLSISDEGPGIPDNEIQAVLSSFGRGAKAHVSATPGVGIGLSIVRGLAELHGGRLVLRRAQRQGLEAAFTLPVSRVVATAPKSVADTRLTAA